MRYSDEEVCLDDAANLWASVIPESACLFSLTKTIENRGIYSCQVYSTWCHPNTFVDHIYIYIKKPLRACS